MHLVLNKKQTIKFDLKQNTATFFSTSGGHDPITPDLFFMCQFMNGVKDILGDSSIQPNIVSNDGNNTMVLYSKVHTGTSCDNFYFDINQYKHGEPISKETMQILFRTLNKMYYDLAH